jgi:hypothetical protein
MKTFPILALALTTIAAASACHAGDHFFSPPIWTGPAPSLGKSSLPDLPVYPDRSEPCQTFVREAIGSLPSGSAQISENPPVGRTTTSTVEYSEPGSEPVAYEPDFDQRDVSNKAGSDRATDGTSSWKLFGIASLVVVCLLAAVNLKG